jgi:TRAP-type mannitol/chloroaromatic compound transport system permease small subunit
MLMAISRAIDGLNDRIAAVVAWGLLAAVLVCAANALIRYSLNASSNAWLEIQWYLFAAVFLLAAPHTLRRDEHVRIDVIVGRFSRRTQVWIDLFGFFLFLLPICCVILYYGIPFGLESVRSAEMSSNSGGLIVWPAKILVPIGFALMILQGLSEIIKRIEYLRGRLDESAFTKQASPARQEIDAIRQANRID